MTQKKALTKDDLLGATKPSFAKRAAAAVAALALIAGGVWYFGFAAQNNVPTYRTVTVDRGNLEVTVTANGTLNPVRTVSIGSELSGIVRKVNVDVNSQVKAGDVLIELDDANLKAKLNQAKATLASAKAALAEAQATEAEAKAKMARYEELNKASNGRLPSRTELDVQRATVLKAQAGVLSAKASIENAQASVETTQTDLEKAFIKSPVDGVVLVRSVEPGYAVAASLQAVELLTVATDLRELELQVDVDEADVGQVKEGQEASFTVASYPNKRFAAELTKVAFGSTKSTTDNVITYTAYLSVKNPELELRPGMTATATIQTAHKADALLIPNTALRFKPQSAAASKSGISAMMGPPHRTGNASKTAKDVTLNQTQRQQTVYVVGSDGRAQAKQVKTGLTNGRMTEVLSDDLAVGTRVITDQLKAAR